MQRTENQISENRVIMIHLSSVIRLQYSDTDMAHTRTVEFYDADFGLSLLQTIITNHRRNLQ